jgi:hypothetical protein
MRKGFLIGAGFVAVLVASAVGGGFWIKSQAEAEVRALLANLSASGAKVSHGAITTALWSRAVAVEALDIKPGGDAGPAITLSRLDVEGINPTGRGSARRIVVHDLLVTDTGGKEPLVRAPRVELSDFAYAPSAAAMASPDTVLRAVAGFAGMKARTIDAPSIATSYSMTGSMTGPPPRPGAPAQTIRVDYTYNDVRLEGVADGRVARARIGKGVIGSGAGSPILSGVIENMDMADLDLLPVFDMGLDRRKPDGRMYKVQGKVSLGPYTIKTIDGGDVSIARMSGDGTWIDPTKVSYGRFMTFVMQAEAMQGGGGTPQQQAAFMASLAEVYDGLRLDSLVVDDMKAKGPGPGGAITLSRIAMLGLDAGKLGEFRLEGLAGKVPGKRGMEALNIGLFALEKLDISGLMKLSQAAMTNPQMKPDAIMSRVMPLLQGVELNGFEFPDQQTGQPVRIEKSKISWGAFINGIPSQMKIAIRGQAPLNGNDPKAAVFVQNGIRAIDLDIDMAARYDSKSQQLTLEPFVVVGAPLGTVSGKLTLANVPQAIFTTNAQQAQAAALTVELGELELNMADGGVITLARKIAGPNFAEPMVAGLRQQPALSPSPPELEALFANVGQFLSAPGQTLTLQLRPKSAARLSEIAAQVMVGGPAALFATLDVTSAVKR